MERNARHNHFKLPDGYFEGLPSRVDDRLKHSLHGEATEKESFKVPEHYFENLESRIQQRLASSPKGVFPLWKNKWLGWSAAAAVLLIFVLRPIPQGESFEFEDLARSDIEAYLETRYSDLSAYELAESLPFSEVTPGDLMEDVPHESQILHYLELKTESYDHYNLENNE